MCGPARSLEHHADAPPVWRQQIARRTRQPAADLNLAIIGPLEAGDQPQQRGLAEPEGPRRTKTSPAPHRRDRFSMTGTAPRWKRRPSTDSIEGRPAGLRSSPGLAIDITGIGGGARTKPPAAPCCADSRCFPSPASPGVRAAPSPPPPPGRQPSAPPPAKSRTISASSKPSFSNNYLICLASIKEGSASSGPNGGLARLLAAGERHNEGECGRDRLDDAKLQLDLSAFQQKQAFQRSCYLRVSRANRCGSYCRSE